jgi:GxxExxY protein
MSATGVLEMATSKRMNDGVATWSTNRKTNYRIDASDALTYPVIGAAMAVHNALGPGLREGHYQRALSLELGKAGLPFVAEQPVHIDSEQGFIGLLYLDHLVADELVVECKAFPHLLTNEEIAQVLTYLCATSKSVGLLFNFGRNRLEYRRLFAPKDVSRYRERIRRYVWIPPDARFVNSVADSLTGPSVRSEAAQ